MTTRRQQCINNANVIKQSVNGKHKLALSFVCLSPLLNLAPSVTAPPNYSKLKDTKSDLLPVKIIKKLKR